MIAEIRGWILKDETFRTSYWGPGAVLGGYRQISGSLFPINPRSFSKDPTTKGRSGPVFPQIPSTEQGAEQWLLAPWGHLPTASLRPHPVKGVSTHNAHDSPWPHCAEHHRVIARLVLGPSESCEVPHLPTRLPSHGGRQPRPAQSPRVPRGQRAKELHPHFPSPGTARGAQPCQGRARPSHTEHPLPAWESLT